MRKLLLVPVAAGLLSSCIYADVKLPRAYRTAVPTEVKSAADDPPVKGRACSWTLLYLVAWGDSGYAAAAKDALKDQPGRVLYDVKSDVQAFSILAGMYGRACTQLTGKAAKS